MSAKEVADKAIALMNKRLTDEVFLIIQNSSELMHEYLMSVEGKGLKSTNMAIGKAVKSAYGLKNADREDTPLSTLIKSWQGY